MRTGKGAKSRDGRQAATPRIISGEELGALASKIRDAIAHRAFELFEARGYERGRDLEDWFRADSELVHPVTATTKINRKDFGLTWNAALETGGILVGDEVTITLDVQFVKA